MLLCLVVPGLSCGEQGLLLQGTGSARVASVIGALGLHSVDSAVLAHGLSCSVACRSSRTQNQTHVPGIGRQILNPQTTREALIGSVLNDFILLLVFFFYFFINVNQEP